MLWRGGQTTGTIHFWLRRKDGSTDSGDLATISQGGPPITLEVKLIYHPTTNIFSDDFYINGVYITDRITNDPGVTFDFKRANHMVTTNSDVTQVMGGTLDWFKITNATYTTNYGTAAFLGTMHWQSCTKFFSFATYPGELWIRDNACFW